MAHYVFDYRLLRLLVGVVALTLPVTVSIISADQLSSISASYYSEARDVFVGQLFVVAALLIAYRGHSEFQNWVSNLAALAAVGIALFPVPATNQVFSPAAAVHYGSAAVMFGILAWFCLVPFLHRTRRGGTKKRRRARIYRLCGWGILLSMGAIITAMTLLPAEIRERWEMIYWLESIALWLFGLAWMTAGKVIPYLSEPREALKLTLFLAYP